MQSESIKRSAGLLVTYAAPVIGLAAVIVVMNATNPLTVGPLGILILLALLYITVVLVLHAVVVGGIAIAGQFTEVPASLKKRLIYMAAILGLAPVFMLALNSIGHVGVMDIALVAIFILLGCFYVFRRVR